MNTTRLFKDRADATLMLAHRLQAYRGAHPLVLAIPRGAVPMAQGIAQALDGELDVVLVRKLGAPFSEEFAVGSVDESGTVYRLPHAAPGRRKRCLSRAGSCAPVGRAASAARTLYAVAPADRPGRAHRHRGRRRPRYRRHHDRRAQALRARQPAKLICAVPVAAPDSLAKVAALADEVVCLHAPQDFAAVGQFYLRFEQVDDDEVAAILAAAGKN